MPEDRFRDRHVRFANGSIGQCIEIPSATPLNYHQMVSAHDAMPRVTIDGQLFMPPGVTQRVPVVIVVPGSLGVGPNNLMHAETISNLGFAAFVLDPFGARQVTSTVANQMQFSYAASAYDVMSAARTIAMLPQIDPARIGILGHSRGGTAVLTAAMRRLNTDASDTSPPMRAVFAAYPWCGHQPLDPDVGDTEIRVLIGDQDDWVSPQSAQGYVQAIRLRGGRASIRLVAGAGHSFDRREPVRYVSDAAIGPHAPITYIANDGSLIHPVTGAADASFTDYDMALYALQSGRGGKGAHIGSKGDEPDVFRDDMMSFFQRTLGA